MSLDAPLPNLPYPEDEGATLLDVLKSPEPDLDFFVSIGALLNECDPWLAAVWRALLQTDGNLTRAAIRLRVHRNTVRAAIKRIVELLRDHGFGDRR